MPLASEPYRPEASTLLSTKKKATRERPKCDALFEMADGRQDCRPITSSRVSSRGHHHLPIVHLSRGYDTYMVGEKRHCLVFSPPSLVQKPR